MNSFTKMCPFIQEIQRSENRQTHGAELSMGWVDPGVGLGQNFFLAFWWVRLGRGSETFPKILILGRSLVTAEVIPDNLIMINTNK